MIEAGAGVALGPAATARNWAGEMFWHLQQAMHCHRWHFRGASVLPICKVLEMVAVCGDQALGIANCGGSLDVS